MDSSRKLPPLILHPFADSSGPGKLVESSRASLMLQGLLPAGERTTEELDRALIDGRYCEIRMLFYVGRDLMRWILQSLDHCERHPDLHGRGIRYQSFASLLVDSAPAAVQAKLKKWGVADFRAIFSRALGLNAIFTELPDADILSDDFIRNYYRYADHLYACKQGQSPFADLAMLGLDFEIYASGEYSRMLEREWQES